MDKIADNIVKKTKAANMPGIEKENFSDDDEEEKVDKDEEEEKENEKRRHEAWGRSVIVRPEITEKLSCSGDIGRTKLELIEDVPILAQSLSKLPDKSWWWDTNEKRNDAGEKMFNSNEPARVFQRRVSKFKQWILSHPSTTFVVFGHSTFFKEMVGRSLKNCEVASIQL